MRISKRVKFLLGILFFAVTSMVLPEAAMAGTEDVIVDGVYIGNVSVGQMTEDEARAAVEEYVNGLMDTTFTLSGENGSIAMTAADMGIYTDIDSAVVDAKRAGKAGNLIKRYKTMQDLKREPLVLDMHLSVDKQKTAQKLYESAHELSQEAVDNTLVREDGVFKIVPGKKGIEVDIVPSVYAINDYLMNVWDGVDNEIKLVSTVVEPRGSEEELSKVKDLLGTFHTDFRTSGAGRTKNVTTGCSKVNGTVLYPGDEFKLSPTISPFTQENGYELAGSYENGTVVESFGGGICQVATTLYNAVILAELEITMRYNHSMQVSYVPPSMDAAIAGDYKDLRFKNNTNAPIYIEGYCNNKIIYFNIYGEETREAGRTISFESEVLSEEEMELEFKKDETLDVGYWNVDQSAHIGLGSQLWKIVKIDGVQKSRDLFNKSTYKSSPKIITIGVKGLSSEQLATLDAAIETGDETTVKDTVDALKNGETTEDPEDAEGDSDDDDDDWEDPEDEEPEDEEPSGGEDISDETIPESDDNTGAGEETVPEEN